MRGKDIDMSKEKLRMSNRRFRSITIPIVSVVTIVTTVAAIAGSLMNTWLDGYLGRGEKVVTNVEDAKNWDLDYYKKGSLTAEEAREDAFKVANEVAKEGIIMLKNNGVLPLAKQSTVMPFGYRYNNPIYCQMSAQGSAKWVIGDEITPEAALKEAFIVDDQASEKMKKAGDPTPLKEAPGTDSATAAGSRLGGDNLLYEYPGSLYDDIAASSGVGLVFIGREGQEGTDKKADAYEDQTPHSLALTQNEKDTIKAAKRICKKVILISECPSAMELDEVMQGELEVDAILWVSQVGERGFSVLDDILVGDVNPSGRTVDIFATDFTKDPSYNNFGNYKYQNILCDVLTFGDKPDIDGRFYRSFVEYEESIYMGYRYYETAHDIKAKNFEYGQLDGKGALTKKGAVNYPFGYGLSYTTFEKNITSFKHDQKTIDVEVSVKNTGKVAGKEVVQLYYTAPYTDYDKENSIEKSTTVLAAFDKTGIIKPGESEKVSLSFDIDDMASYSYKHENKDHSKGCYILEEGTYRIDLKNNSHDLIDSRELTIDKTEYFQGDNLRKSDREGQSAMDDLGNILPYPQSGVNGEYTPVSNLFQQSSDHMNKQARLLSRKDWDNTFPKKKESRLLQADEETVKQFEKNLELNFDPETDEEFGNVPTSKVYADKMPNYNPDKTLSVIDMRGKDYYDENWDVLLDQIDWNKNATNIVNGLVGASYNAPAIEDIGLPATVFADGVNGLKVQGADSSGYDMRKTSTFGMAPLMSATWNQDLLEEVGKALGRESLCHNVSGFYSPAINLHRSPFGARVFEYFSEDPLLTGKLAKAEVEGATSQGMVCFIKHFALNDQETNRSRLGTVWADEQTARELYFKAFEIPVKEAKTTIEYIKDKEGTHGLKVMRATTGVMATQCNIGTVPGHTNYNLQTELLRNEWGFKGSITTDYWVWGVMSKVSNGNNLRDWVFRTGGDLYLCFGIPGMVDVVDKTSPTAINTYRRCIKDIAYTFANSNAMQNVATGAIISYKTSPWRIALTTVECIVYPLAAISVAIIVLRHIDDKKHPDRYNHKKRE